MTHEELDALDDQITAAIAVLCREAGAENDYPAPRGVREVFKSFGLSIVLVAPSGD